MSEVPSTSTAYMQVPKMLCVIFTLSGSQFPCFSIALKTRLSSCATPTSFLSLIPHSSPWLFSSATFFSKVPSIDFCILKHLLPSHTFTFISYAPLLPLPVKTAWKVCPDCAIPNLDWTNDFFFRFIITSYSPHFPFLIYMSAFGQEHAYPSPILSI